MFEMQRLQMQISNAVGCLKMCVNSTFGNKKQHLTRHDTQKSEGKGRGGRKIRGDEKPQPHLEKLLGKGKAVCDFFCFCFVLFLLFFFSFFWLRSTKHPLLPPPISDDL